MFTVKKAKITRIKGYLSSIYCFVVLSNSEGLTDDSKELEDFACGLLNILFGCNLVNLNTVYGNNYPAVDIGDELIKRAFQVSSDSSKLKISDSLDKFNNHKLYEKFLKPEFIIFVPSRRKPNGFANYTDFVFDPKTDIYYINDLHDEIAKNESKIDDLLMYIEANLDPLLKGNNTQQSQEMILFKTLFLSVAEYSRSGLQSFDPSNTNLNAPDESDLTLKKEKFNEFWSLIEQNYSDIIDAKREKIYAEVEKTFSDDELISVRRYLKLESRKCLFEAENNPVKGIELLKNKMIADLGIQFMSEVEIEYFLYYQLHYCFVFPL